MNLAIWDIESSSASTDFGSIIEIVDVTGSDGFGHCGENFKDAYYIFKKLK